MDGMSFITPEGEVSRGMQCFDIVMGCEDEYETNTETHISQA
jgi:hypothetical protein